MPKDLRWLNLSLILWGIGDGLFLYIQPLYMKELGADPVAIGAILGAMGLATALSLVPAGFVADRFGPKTVMLAGWVIGTAACGLMFAARSLPAFVAAVLLYASTGWVLPAINAYATQNRGDHTIERALTTTSAAYAGGGIVSPAIGGWLAGNFGTRNVYGVATVLFLVSTLAILLVSSRPVKRVATRQRYEPLFRNGRFLRFLALILGVFVAIDLGLPFYPNFLADRHGLDVAQVGSLGSATAFGWVILSMILGRRPPRRGFMVTQALLMLALVALLRGDALPWFILAYFLRGAFAPARNLAMAQVGRVVNAPEIGLAYGITETVSSLALMIAPVLAGWFYSLSPERPFQVSFLATAVAILLTWRFAPRLESAPSTKYAPERVQSTIGD